MAQADPRIRQIKIKTGVVKRIAKEKVAYEKEAEQQEERIQKMKDQNKDEHDIRKQLEVLQETKSIVPDCLKRLNVAMADLQGILDTQTDLAQTEEYKAAKTALTQAMEVIPK